MNIRKNERGFFTMIAVLILLIIIAVGFAYMRVQSKQHEPAKDSPGAQFFREKCAEPTKSC